MEQNFTRSMIGVAVSSASWSTRLLKASQDSSRLKNRPLSGTSVPGGMMSRPTGLSVMLLLEDARLGMSALLVMGERCGNPGAGPFASEGGDWTRPGHWLAGDGRA